MIGSQQLVFNITWVSQCEFFCLSPLGRYKEYVLIMLTLGLHKELRLEKAEKN